MVVHPLIFNPIFKPKIWGGRRLATILGKPLPPDALIGESWEIADLEEDQTTVRGDLAGLGPAAGKTLHQLVAKWGPALTGRAPLVDGRFPLLIKLLDAQQTLSVQVHPTAEVAARLGGRVRVKHEAWYVLDAGPDGFIYRGLAPGVDAAALRAAIERREVEPCLRRVPVKAGECYYLPSGTLHALGAGVLVAEVQTPSDITYRIYDFDRVDPATGRPRELHVEDALRCISYEAAPEEAERRSHVASVWTAVTRLVTCAEFVIERVRMIEGVEQMIPYEEPVVWMVLKGAGEVSWKAGSQPLRFGVGDTVLLPAGLKEGRVRTHADCVWLEVTVPVASSLAGYDRPDSSELRRATAAAPEFVPLTKEIMGSGNRDR